MKGLPFFFTVAALISAAATPASAAKATEALRQVRLAESLVSTLETTDPMNADLQGLEELTLPELLPVQDVIARVHGTWRVFEQRSKMLPLLPKGAAQRDYLVKMIEFLTQAGTAPSGSGSDINFWSMGRTEDSIPFYLLNGSQAHAVSNKAFELWIRKHPHAVANPVARLKEVETNLKSLNNDALRTAFNYLKNAEVLFSK